MPLHRKSRMVLSLLLGIMIITSIVLPASPAYASEQPAGLAQTTTANFIKEDAVWQYLDNGSNPGTAWRDPDKSVSGWKSGPAPLGYDDKDVKTTVSFGKNKNKKHPITYFRHEFDVQSASRVTALSMVLEVDDGAIVYVNGKEAYRTDNLKKGSKLPYTDGNACTGGNFKVKLDPKLLRDGKNLIAVEVHQCTPSSSDLLFWLKLEGQVAPEPTQAPTQAPTTAPTAAPTQAPTEVVTEVPTEVPT